MNDPNLDTRPLFGNAVGSTLATALYARATGAQTFGVHEWDDPQARLAWSELSRVAGDQGIDVDALVLTDRMNVVGTIRRSQDMDDAVRAFADLHGGITVVTLGIGLCNRAARLTDLDAAWIGIDSADVVALREAVVPDDPTRLVAGSVVDKEWLDEVRPDPDRPTILVAEGLFMYLTRDQIAGILSRIGVHFPGPTRVVADLHHSILAAPRASIAKLTGADFHYGAPSPKAFAALSPGWHVVGAEPTMGKITRTSAVMSRILGAITQGQMYGVITIGRNP